jgi:hypothetical protein
MAFAGIFQPFARLRWIRFGLLMRDRKFSRRFSVPQTTAFAPFAFANRTITSVACSAFLAITVQARTATSAAKSWLRLRQGKEQRKEGRQEVRGEEGETKEVTLAD